MNTKFLFKVSTITILLLLLGVQSGFSQMATDEDLNRLCDEKNSTACFNLGKKALSLDKDKKKALSYFSRSCDMGHMTACNFSGILIQNKGRQYSPEWKKAAKLFEKSCAADEDAACFNLGALFYKEGRAKKAKKWFQKACDVSDKKNLVACNNAKKMAR